jgi:hypothetical protein
MTTPFLSVIGAAFYFGWLWHNRTTSSPAEARSLDRDSSPRSKHQKQSHRLLR